MTYYKKKADGTKILQERILIGHNSRISSRYSLVHAAALVGMNACALRPGKETERHNTRLFWPQRTITLWCKQTSTARRMYVHAAAASDYVE